MDFTKKGVYSTHISIYLPETTDSANGHFHSVEEVARGLAAMPRALCRQLTHVQVDPGRNPADPHWAQKYGNPNVRSYMTAKHLGLLISIRVGTPLGKARSTAPSSTRSVTFYLVDSSAEIMIRVGEIGKMLCEQTRLLRRDTGAPRKGRLLRDVENV